MTATELMYMNHFFFLWTLKYTYLQKKLAYRSFKIPLFVTTNS